MYTFFKCQQLPLINTQEETRKNNSFQLSTYNVLQQQEVIFTHIPPPDVSNLFPLRDPPSSRSPHQQPLLSSQPPRGS